MRILQANLAVSTLLAVAVIGGGSGCGAKATKPEAATATKGDAGVEADSSPSVPVEGTFAPLEPPNWGEPKAPRVEPEVPSHPAPKPYAMGWAEDGGDFGLCVHPAGETCSQCIFADRAGGESQLSDCEDASKTSEIEERIAERKYADPNSKWKFPRAWLVWDVIEGDGSQAKSSARLRFGASVDQRIPVYDHNITKPEHANLHPEMIALSPNGQEVGVISHSTAPNGSDAYEVRVVDSGEIVAAAENGAGLFSSTREEYDIARQHYHRAAHADLSHPWAMYNLACTLARDADPASRAALEEALLRNDAGVRPKLDTDEDLEPLRSQDWFLSL